jgi:diguanylate cyclase
MASFDGGARNAEQRPSLARTGTALSDDALAASREQLSTAQREIDTLRRRESALKQRVAALLKAIAKARRFAYHDELTGLPNRRLLMDRFDQAVALAERRHKQVALLFLDIDGFKDINDTFGHTAGDDLLRQVAARLSACIRVSDTACRYGGDEFVVLIPDVDGEQTAVVVARKISAHLAAPYVVGGTETSVTTSTGMAVYPVDGRAYRDLTDVSDREMYRNKAATATAIGRRRPAGSVS